MATSSESLADTVRQVFAGGRAAVLAGNVGDFHVGPERSIIGFEQLIALAVALDGASTVSWTPATGTRQVIVPGRGTIRFAGPGPSRDLAPALHHLLEALDDTDQPTVVIIDWVSSALGRPDEPLGLASELICNAANDAALLRAGHRLLVVDRDGNVASVLGRLPGMRVLNVALPNIDERLAFLLHLECVHRSPDLATIGDGETIERIAHATNGMSLRSLHALMGELRHQQRPLSVDALLPVKREFVVQHTDGALRALDGDHTLDEIAGLHNIKLLVDEQRAAPGHPMRHLVLSGPPGTGKNTVATALGPATGRTPVALGLIRDKWVGASEQRMQTVISTVDALAPAIVFVDEMDQTLAGDDGPSGDSGVTKRINALFWEWTGKVGPEQGVLVVGATNRPEALGDRVRDRFTIVPVLHPDPAEAQHIVSITAARLGRGIDGDGLSEILALQATPLSGRTLAELVHNAAGIADRSLGSRSDVIDAVAMRTAFDDRLPHTGANDDEVMTLQAIRFTQRRSLLPWVAAQRRGADYRIAPYLAPFVDRDGTVDVDALNARITELTRFRA